MNAKKEYAPDSAEAFRERLKQVRERANLDQYGMAGQLRVKWTTYYKYETGERRPCWTVLFRIPRIFNVSFDWLLLGKGEMIYNEQIPKREVEILKMEWEEKRLQELQREKETAATEKQHFEEQIKNLKEKMEQMEESVIPGLKPDVKELVQVMDTVPLLYYEIMLQFQRFKADNENLISATMNAAKKASG